MQTAPDLSPWLLWIIKIRFVIITLVFALDFAIRVLAPAPGVGGSVGQLGAVVVLWYCLGLFYLMYYQLSRDYVLQAYLQIFSDLLMITAVVHVTGDLASNYLSLYWVAVIMASVLLPRTRAFLVAAVAFVCMGSLLELAYLPSLYPSLASRHPWTAGLENTSTLLVDARTLGVKIFASLLGFFAVAYLSSYLGESLRRARLALRDKAGEVASLHALNENIIRSIRSGLIATDLHGIVQELNPAGAEILGCQVSEVKGQPVAKIFPALASDEDTPPEPAHGQEGPPQASVPLPDAAVAFNRREITYATCRGETRILGISASPLTGAEGTALGCIYTFQDLTEEKRREAEYRAKDRMATLGRMAASIAHEIRNPLASIAGSARLLQTIGDADRAALFDIVRRESARLERLVSNFLAYSREERFNFQEVDLVALLSETLLLVEQHPLFVEGCRLVRVFPDHPVPVRADPDKLQQVVWNLCDNATKAMGQQACPADHTLTVQVEAEAERVVRLIVADTGPGFAAAQLNKLFEPFHSSFANGTGLGLALVRRVVEGHGGTVSVDSEPGKGTRIVVELPSTEENLNVGPGDRATIHSRPIELVQSASDS